MESQRVESIIQENLQNGRTPSIVYNGRKDETVMNSLNDTNSDNLTLPKRRGRKPKKPIVSVASIDPSRNIKIDDNESSLDSTYISVGSNSDHSYSLNCNNSQLREKCDLEESDTNINSENKFIERRGSRIKSVSLTFPEEESSISLSGSDSINVETDSSSSLDSVQKPTAEKQCDSIVSNINKITTENENTIREFNSRFGKSTNSLLPVVILNKLVTYSGTVVSTSTTIDEKNVEEGNMVIKKELSTELKKDDNGLYIPVEKVEEELAVLETHEEVNFKTSANSFKSALSNQQPESSKLIFAQPVVLKENLESSHSRNQQNIFLSETDKSSDSSKQSNNHIKQNYCDTKSNSAKLNKSESCLEVDQMHNVDIIHPKDNADFSKVAANKICTNKVAENILNLDISDGQVFENQMGPLDISNHTKITVKIVDESKSEHPKHLPKIKLSRTVDNETNCVKKSPCNSTAEELLIANDKKNKSIKIKDNLFLNDTKDTIKNNYDLELNENKLVKRKPKIQINLSELGNRFNYNETSKINISDSNGALVGAEGKSSIDSISFLNKLEVHPMATEKLIEKSQSLAKKCVIEKQNCDPINGLIEVTLEPLIFGEPKKSLETISCSPVPSEDIINQSKDNLVHSLVRSNTDGAMEIATTSFEQISKSPVKLYSSAVKFQTDETVKNEKIQKPLVENCETELPTLTAKNKAHSAGKLISPIIAESSLDDKIDFYISSSATDGQSDKIENAREIGVPLKSKKIKDEDSLINVKNFAKSPIRIKIAPVSSSILENSSKNLQFEANYESISLAKNDKEKKFSDEPQLNSVVCQKILNSSSSSQNQQQFSQNNKNTVTIDATDKISQTKARKSRWSSIAVCNNSILCKNVDNSLEHESTNVLSTAENLKKYDRVTLNYPESGTSDYVLNLNALETNKESDIAQIISTSQKDTFAQTNAHSNRPFHMDIVRTTKDSSVWPLHVKNVQEINNSSLLPVKPLQNDFQNQYLSPLSMENLKIPGLSDTHDGIKSHYYQPTTLQKNNIESNDLDEANELNVPLPTATSRKSRWSKSPQDLPNTDTNKCDSKIGDTESDTGKFEKNCTTNEVELTNCENKIKRALFEIARKLKNDKDDKKLSTTLNESEENKSKINKRKQIVFKDLLSSMDLFSTDPNVVNKTKSDSNSKTKHTKKRKNKLSNKIENEDASNVPKRRKRKHEHSKMSKRTTQNLNNTETDTSNSILNSTKTSLSEKALSFLESLQLQNIERNINRESLEHQKLITKQSKKRGTDAKNFEIATSDPLGDIEKFIEAGENLLSYSRPSAPSNPEDESSTSKSPCQNLVENSTDQFYEHTKNFDNGSDSENSARDLYMSNKSTTDVDKEVFLDNDDEDESNTGSVRRSHRIKTKSKSLQSIVGRGVVSTIAYSISGHKEDLAKIHIRNVKFLKEMEDRLSKFCMIDQNEYKCERIISKEARKMICDCFLTTDEEERGEFGCGEDCLNRLLMIECGAECVVGDRCTNRRFHNLLYSPCQVFRTEKKGFGIHAENDIMPGEFIMEYVGEVIDGVQFAKRRDDYSKEKNKHYYFMALQNDCIIDATSRGNISRFINHSCDPNAETQKWTVNGELRIGFFSTKRIKAGDEITFDYQFQRYGKEAQKCFCESSNCRGWIGKEPDSEEEEFEENDYDSTSDGDDIDNEENIDSYNENYNGEALQTLKENNISDDDEDYVAVENKNGILKKGRGRKAASNKENTKIGRKTTRKYKRREIWIGKKNDLLEDMDIEDEVQSLLRSGLVNQEHTLRLSRLMVRSKMIETRLKLLEIIRDGDIPCRRLFLDYHGLRLLHGWMNEIIETETSEKVLEIRLALLDTLEVLPITNKNRLIDSKVYQTVQNWAKKKELLNSSSPNQESSNDSDSIVHPVNPTEENIKTEFQEPCNDSPKDQIIIEIQKLAEKLIVAWDVLPENFKIPKRERIEQMKEHEREADQQYMSLTLMDEDNNSFNKSRYIKSRNLNDSKFKWFNDKSEQQRNQKKSLNDDLRLKDPSLSKAQRRELFAAKVVRDEAEKRIADQRREFEIKCRFFGYDPKVITLKDMPFCVDSATGQWYTADHREIPTPPSHTHVVLPEKPKSVDPQDYELPEINLPPLWKFAIDNRGRIYYYHSKIRIPQWLPPVKKELLDDENYPQVESTDEPNEQVETEEETDDSISCTEEDIENLYEEQDHEEYIENKIVSRQERRYSMMVQERPISPRRDEDRINSKIEMRKYKENKEKIRKRKEEMRRRAKLAQTDKPPDNSTISEAKTKEDDDSVPIHAYLYSSDEEVDIKAECSSPLIDSIIQCDKIVDELDAIKKRKSLKRTLIKENYQLKKYVKHEKRIKLENDFDDSGSGSNYGRSSLSTSTKSKPKELDGNKYRKSREKFRCDIAGIIVQHLSRYCKDNCTTGRITSSEDFKHLARKLTHFVLLKELKYCHSVGQELIVTESVKNKSKAFIKKYMTKYGTTYIRPSSDPEFKDISFDN